jgi:hypothetical protein
MRKRETRGYFNVAVAHDPSLKDVTISVRSRAVAGQEDEGGGPVWRCRDLRNYFIARQNNLENNYRIYKVVNGRRIRLGSARLEARTGACQTAARRLTNFSAAIRPPSAARRATRPSSLRPCSPSLPPLISSDAMRSPPPNATERPANAA